ncbi:hypothetical protein PSM7751_00740 [Pseudooceanicola marinus]|uniref:Uncharacterized protein n=1 Tax=Pseudooceanicola marinus TaxID=396013 RepID=A0A1X6YGQ9_9RHOB|nr:hypothetical protein [Pseudooceanicola marinus]SLN21210.1 hypothetical protein PSM7751_00740 [Pseudooceanicola marinus]
MVNSPNRLSDFTDNTHRSLKRLVVVDAWFQRSLEDPRRFTLYADVSFNIERLGGGKDTAVTFKVGVKQCEIVFIRPLSGFSVDRSSVRRQKPMSPQEITLSKQRKASGGVRTKLGLSHKPSLEAGIEGNISATSERSSTLNLSKSSYNEQFTRSREGHDAWSVNGQELGGCLMGPVFDVRTEPRLTLIDIRNEERRSQEEANALTPTTHIEVRCLREDIDIFDIRLKDEDKEGRLLGKPGRKERVLIARGVIREALISEGLSVGHLIDDPYAEMTICDATIPILDQSS